MVADLPEHPSLRNRISARLLGGTSGGVFRGMLTLALGSGVGRLIGFAAIPVLTRLYTPEDFGVLALFTALVAILAPLVTLRYELALPLPSRDGVAMNLLVLSSGLMLGLTAVIAVPLWLWGATLLSLGSLDVLAPWWWLIAFGILGTACYDLLTMWATRSRAYKIIAQTNVTQSAAGALVKIGMGMAAVQPLGLLVGQVVAQAGGVGRLLSAFRAELQTNWRHVSVRNMRKVGWRYRGFPIWRVPSQFLMVFSMQAPMLFMTALYNPETTGQFGLAALALTVPVTLLGQSAGRALYGEASRAIKTDRSRVLKMCKETQLRLLAIAIPPASIIFFFGDDIFVFVFGEAWVESGFFASLLSIAMVFQFTSAPLIQVMNFLTDQAAYLKINFLRFASLGVVFFLASRFSLEAYHTVLLMALFSMGFYIFVSVFVMRALSKETAWNGR